MLYHHATNSVRSAWQESLCPQFFHARELPGLENIGRQEIRTFVTECTASQLGCEDFPPNRYLCMPGVLNPMLAEKAYFALA